MDTGKFVHKIYPYLIFCFIFISLYKNSHSFRSYNFFHNGSRHSGLGNILSISIPSTEAVFYNPSLLISEQKNSLAYEFDTSIIFRGVTADYRLSFDIFSLGAVFPITKFNQKHVFGINFSTYLKSSGLSQTRQIGLNQYSVRLLGFSHAIELSNQWSIAYRTALAIGIDSDAGIRNFRLALFPHFFISLLGKLSKRVTYGLSVDTPLFLNWSATSSINLKEITPYRINTGFQFILSPQVDWLLELSYQGWDNIRYTQNNVNIPTQDGMHAFDWGQNVFLSSALYIHSSDQYNFNESQKKENQKRKIKREKIREINQEVREINSFSYTNYLNKKISSNQTLMRKYYQQRKVIITQTISQDKNEQIKSINQNILKIKKQIQNKNQAKQNLNILIGYKKLSNKISLEIKELEQKKIAQEEILLNIKKNNLSLSNQNKLNNLQASIDQLKETDQYLHREKNKIIRNEENYIQKIEAKIQFYESQEQKENQLSPLSREEEWIYRRHQRLKTLTAEKKRIKKSSLKRFYTKIIGEYYIGFYPEVAYQENGNFQRNGNLTFGATFALTKSKSAILSLAIIDKSLLSFLRIYPDNDLSEDIKVTFLFYF